ncbi:MAG: Gfo/Idh/MocA family oxidoreductase [Armatimonadetes bacterium]|nr:Gfo/Idh/MocA family oxidoreductase [Armatimonadota bacterium]MDW8122301.1 Gfo/Idh/MocA family oxidoreductase [Armatimonadota bacterium]
METNFIRLGFIGCGVIASAHLRNLKAIPEARVVAFSDPNWSAAERLARAADLEPGPQTVFPDWRQMLDMVPLNGVLVLSPHSYHAEQVIACLEKGLAVLVEKPLAVSVDQVQTIVRKKDERGGIVVVSYQRRYMPAFRFVREQIRSGAIGRLEVAYGIVGHGWKRATQGTWRQVPTVSGGGMLMDSGSHLVDIVLWTLPGRPAEVTATLSHLDSPVEINDIVTIRMDDGCLVSLVALGDLPYYKETYEFIGTDGTLKVDLTVSPPVTRYASDGQPTAVPEQDMGPPSNPDRNLVDLILGKGQNESPPEEALRVLAVTEAAYRAASDKSWVTLNQ